MARHFAAAIIRRTDPDTGVHQLLLLHYHPVNLKDGVRERNRGYFQIKFPGGDQKFDETPKETCRRKVIDETGLTIRGAREVCAIPRRGHHTQYYFGVEFPRCKGKVRTTKVEGQRSDLWAPVWVDEDKVANILHHTHRTAFLEYQKKGF